MEINKNTTLSEIAQDGELPYPLTFKLKKPITHNKKEYTEIELEEPTADIAIYAQDNVSKGSGTASSLALERWTTLPVEVIRKLPMADFQKLSELVEF